ncbi:DUF3102 domain-containing protein [Psychrobacter aquaticus]|uniref:DUF3102 domain-containing protein n=1 Tax=Psychrobacter aquaticus CMS 56 TaxID=1354303 RepID=U4T493_9GAMM|nr:DUF3102 domain-containing protein [Psychrobacter aquaticus]ERL56167.1 hypothetical protein M917_0845 [Psychrobacter aquaticus CMS 56]
MKDITPDKDANVTTTNQLAISTARLATSLGYEGSLTIGTLEDGIRFYQQRTAEACVEMGKRLLILKEMCPHGEFQTRLEVLGFQTRTAQKFMQAVLKISNASTPTLLSKVGSQSKLLELVTLDDDQIEALSNGDSIGDITLDDIETMSVRELKKAIKDARSDTAAKDELLNNKNKKIDELDAKISLRRQPDQQYALDQEREVHITGELAQSVTSLLTAISQFNASIITLRVQADEDVPHLSAKIDADVSYTYGRIAELATIEGIDIDLAQMITPDWMNEETVVKIPAATSKPVNKAEDAASFQAWKQEQGFITEDNE